MEEESFEDLEIAAFINAHYVCVKVDREERPDVDAMYMSAVQRLTGSGGWPMSVWLNAEREPFFGGTYFPPRDGARGARLGFLSLLGELRATFDRDPDRVRRAAASLVAVVREDMEGERTGPGRGGGRPAGADGSVARQVRKTRWVTPARPPRCPARGDRRDRGLLRAPSIRSTAASRARRSSRPTCRSACCCASTAARATRDALHMAVLTLQKMAAGGCTTSSAAGFTATPPTPNGWCRTSRRCCTTTRCLVVAYCEAYQVTARPEFARVARETCDYVLREMTSPAGGFYSATDADSQDEHGHAEEGRFFVWTASEVRRELGAGGFDDDTIAAFLDHYDVTPEGNWEGNAILRVLRPDEAMTERLAPARAPPVSRFGRVARRRCVTTRSWRPGTA